LNELEGRKVRMVAKGNSRQKIEKKTFHVIKKKFFFSVCVIFKKKKRIFSRKKKKKKKKKKVKKQNFKTKRNEK